MTSELIAVLFAFAIQAGGYTDFCKQNECKPSAVVVIESSDHVRGDRNGWYLNGTSYVKTRDVQVKQEITTVHELTHHLQRLSGRYHGLKGACNKYGGEREAHEVGEAYAKSKGWTTHPERIIGEYRNTCVAAVEAGLLKKPDWMKE